MRRTTVMLICRRTKYLRAVQVLLGHTRMEGAILYLGIEIDDGLAMSANEPPRSFKQATETYSRRPNNEVCSFPPIC
jgi:hypothetical protein